MTTVENGFLSPMSDEIREIIKECLYLSTNDDLQNELFKLRNIFEEFVIRSESKDSSSSLKNSSASKWILNLENAAFAVWNLISINHSNFSQKSIVTVDFLILNIVTFVYNVFDKRECDVLLNSSSRVLDYLKISTRTCLALLDCEQFERGEKVLHMASQFIEIFPCQDSLSKYKFLNEISWVKIYAQRGKDDEAFLHVHKAKDFASESAQCQIYLTRLCYNLGLELLKEKKFERSTTWLKISFQTGIDLSKYSGDLSEFGLSNTLNTLAQVYLFWGEVVYWEKAVDAIQLSEKYGNADFLIKVRALICGESDHEILLAHSRWINFEPSISDAYQIIKSVVKYKRFSVALQIIYEMETKIGKDNVGIFLSFYVGNLEDSNFDEVENIFKYFVEKRPLFLAAVNADRLFAFTLRQAHVHQTSQKFNRALVWYNFSEHFASFSENTQNIVSVMRSRCLCYLRMNDLQELGKEMEKMKSFERKNCVDYYLEFRFNLLTEEKSRAIDAVKMMGTFLESDTKNCEQLLCLAIQGYLKDEECKESYDFIFDVLEKIIECSNDSFLRVNCIKIFIRLKLKAAGTVATTTLSSQLCVYINYVYSFLSNLKKNTGDADIPLLSQEARWFATVSWNLALQTTSSNDQIHSGFLLCSRFLSLFSSNDIADVTTHQTTFLLIAASCTALAENETDIEKKKNIYRQVVEEINQNETLLHEYINKKLGPDSFHEFLKINLMLYKFNAFARTNNPSASNILDDILCLNHSDTSTLEKLAAIINNCGLQYLHMKIRVLKTIISKQKQQQDSNCNFTTLSAFYRSLICGLFEKFSIKDDNDLIWDAVHEGVQFIMTTDKYPEIEVLWLMIKIWNVGIGFLAEKHDEMALKWCLLAASLLSKLPRIGPIYEPKIKLVLDTHLTINK